MIHVLRPILTACLILASPAVAASDEAVKQILGAAEAQFQAGKFADAETLYRKAEAREPGNVQALLGLGRIALYSNRLKEAREWLARAIKGDPDSKAAKSLLAEVYTRQDDFRRAAPLLRAVGQEAAARQLESFHATVPYQIEAKSHRTVVNFVVTDPLPVVRVKVNDGPEVNFFIDTGASQVMLDTDFARELGIKDVGAVTGQFAGGKQASVGHGRIDSLTLGDLVVRNVPVAIINTRQFARPVFGGRRVDGIIGTVLFYHFLATLDYPHGELVLYNKKIGQTLGRIRLDKLEEEARKGRLIVVPFWMAGDHYMVAWGKAENEPVLFFVDTGLAGGGVTLADSAIKAAGIKLRESEAGEGIGGGGRVKTIPFEVKDLSLGGAVEHNVHGLNTGAFPIERALGFRVGGIISHGFFRTYALTFDFGNMRLVLRRTSEPASGGGAGGVSR